MAAEVSYDPLITNSSDVYWRDDDKEAIMESLFSKIDDDKISVIPIVGMGGVGKTTLAQLVYNDNTVKHHFELRAWVTVSDDFDVFKLAKQALEDFTGENSEVRELESLTWELEKILRGKKFLLVLDDVWTENYVLWNNLKSCFQFGAEGSKIIVTTRDEMIGSKMGSVPSHCLYTMSDEECWQLFTKHAFHNIEPNVCRDLEEIGRAIVKKCRGLPLAVMLLAGLLRSVSDPKEWEAVLQSDVWELHKNGLTIVAAEAVAGALLSVLLNTLRKKLASDEVRNFFEHNWSVMSKLVEKLNGTLLSANELLNDAEDKQVTDPNIKNWVDTLNELLSEAEHVVDKINTEALRRGNKAVPEGKCLCLKRLVPSSFNAFDRAIKQEIEKITESLDSHMKHKDELGLKEGAESKRLLKRSYDPPIANSSDVYGRDDDKKAIMESLFSKNDDDKISVIPIVGMGGVGKTTLARLVYDDNSVNRHFELRAWVNVSDDFDVFKLAKLALEDFTGENSEVREEERLMDELQKILRGKKFLLVLDDVWNENYAVWNKLKSCFQFGEEESKIIVTTRNETIGSKMGSVPSHRLNTMSDEDCWQLFTKHAFHNIEPIVCRDLEEIGRAIVKKCRGLPLAVMSLARLLHSESDPKEWEAVLQSDVWDLHEKGSYEVILSLWLSYSYLPSHLKRCFACCSIFPKDYEYDKKKIILFWMAEGLLQGENTEDVGEEYFKTLISRSLFQRSTSTESSVVMHDFVLDLATFVSGKGFCDILTKARHLLCVHKGLSKENCVRSFISLPWSIRYKANSDTLLKKLQLLRALCLSKFDVVELPESIWKLKHLRYLDLSYTDINRLPDAVCSLYNLQTLLLNGCFSLTELPTNMGRLLNLRHLDLRETRSLKKMPLCIWNLKGLRTVTKDGSLEIAGLENVINPKDVLEAEFEKKSGFTEITLEWSFLRSGSLVEKDRATLDAFKPHVSLKKLKIINYGGTQLSYWFRDGSFTNMTEVSLLWCTRCQLPTFEQLQSLRKLDISGLRSVKTIHWKASSFSNLECLSIAFMDELQSWSLEGVAFGCLKELKLSECPEMELSCEQMNATFLSLVKLQIDHCPKLEITGLPLPSSLEKLCIWNCEKLMAQRMQWGLLTTSLKELTIGGCEDLMDTFPEEGLLPTTLQELEIRDVPNMKALNGNAFQHLTSLTHLTICKCPKLECLPEQGPPAFLTYFCVHSCRLLEARLQRGTGKDWNKIFEIQSIYVSCY